MPLSHAVRVQETIWVFATGLKRRGAVEAGERAEAYLECNGVALIVHLFMRVIATVVHDPPRYNLLQQHVGDVNYATLRFERPPYFLPAVLRDYFIEELPSERGQPPEGGFYPLFVSGVHLSG